MSQLRRWWPVGLVAAALALVLAVGTAVAFAGGGDRGGRAGADPAAQTATGHAAPGAVGARTLVLYDDSPHGELYATQTANLVSHFGAWTAKPVDDYTAGEHADYTAMVYLGTSYDAPLSEPFLADVRDGQTPVLWVRDNIWQLLASTPDFTAEYGVSWAGFDTSAVDEVRYQGARLTRDTVNESGLGELDVLDEDQVEVLASAVRPDGSRLPWALRTGELTYVSEIPFMYVNRDDRYLAFTDLLFDLLAPETPERHRALVRLEDVGPTDDPEQLREIVDYLAEEEVPFSVAVFPVFSDPQGVEGEPGTVRLTDRPELVAELRHAVDQGGTLLMHGYTHQYEDVSNPYNGLSGADFEFFRAHVDEQDHVQLDGPAAGDSPEWTRERLAAGLAEFDAAGLPRPTIFEFPHYAAGPNAYAEVAERFAARYDRGMYFPGLLSGREIDDQAGTGQFVPYPVRDVYGSVVVPENLGEITETGFNQHPATLPADLLASAERNLVVRDGVASFFYHPYLGLDHLEELVTGVRELGYEFAAAEELQHGRS
ncbi:polysaccharide deacetylase family protein [Natronosporangium hydrolyticum]|uniref:Polysaccharide deacetylase family protein n=1 Tax=Natronosporangium hydrolyticum TaxID=2811111 RepID=A0A895YI47_9ACTN|nr:polysaccharide deacetylase family protein [Natronosporangium hydrolyticum]QSB15199.1 polysaccharide deacetylase family protein [Natronosporangium hydrolyticum]